jgi:pyridoxine 4-dehydrogenase
VLGLCREHGIAWTPFFPLGSASVRHPRVTDDPTVIATAGELAVTPAQVGLAWLLAHYEDTLLIPGTSDTTHLAENIAAGAIRLPASSVEASTGWRPSASATYRPEPPASQSRIRPLSSSGASSGIQWVAPEISA